MVSRTGIAGRSSSGSVSGSPSSTARSARRPGPARPPRARCSVIHAPPTVSARSASIRLRRSAGPERPAPVRHVAAGHDGHEGHPRIGRLVVGGEAEGNARGAADSGGAAACRRRHRAAPPRRRPSARDTRSGLVVATAPSRLIRASCWALAPFRCTSTQRRSRMGCCCGDRLPDVEHLGQAPRHQRVDAQRRAARPARPAARTPRGRWRSPRSPPTPCRAGPRAGGARPRHRRRSAGRCRPRAGDRRRARARPPTTASSRMARRPPPRGRPTWG